ncbi:MAG: hypothetical protein CMP23_16070 [Rickettsiales bacterium]|nr:hypothetical protein [Rickettsiales bacterium]|tara:strand:- start:1940 stop:3274 length:1335 start_codon:yes stop_codon:yes gene_type:complete
MSPSIRRYLPIVAVVGLLLVAVYFGQPDRMTGSAAGSGCAGGQGQLITENEAGAVTKGAQDAVRAIIDFDVMAAEAGQTKSMDDLKGELEDMGTVAVPALLEELRDLGCLSANADELVDVVRILGDQPDFDGMIYPILADALLEAATMALDDAGEGNDREMVAGLDDAGSSSGGVTIAENNAGEEAVEVTAMEDTAGDSEGSVKIKGSDGFGPAQECASEALDLISEWAGAEVDGEVVIKKLMAQIDDLAAGSKSAIELVELLDEVAPRDAEWAATFEAISLEQTMDKEARGLACDAAVARESELSEMRSDLSAVTSPFAAVCLVEASSSFEDTSVATWGLKSDEPDVRGAALTVLEEAGGVANVEDLLAHLFIAAGAEPRGYGEAERMSTVKTIASLIEASENEASELLVGAVDLASQAGAVGEQWLGILDDSISSWEAPVEG